MKSLLKPIPRKEKFHHSSLLAGQPVAAAGTLSVTNGVLLSVSNQSGHYQPTQNLNNQLFDELESRGMDSNMLDETERAGWKNDESSMKIKKHKDFKKSENWKPDDEVPEDWEDF